MGDRNPRQSHPSTVLTVLDGRATASPAKRRYRYRRRHTPHYYIVLTGLPAAALVCLLNAIAYAGRSVALANVTFVAEVFTSLVVFVAYFWGFYMMMSGHIPVKRLKMLVPHAAVGTLAPLLYTVNISVAVDGFGTQPVGKIGVVCSVASFMLLCVQFAMGKAVVRPEPLRIVRDSGVDA